MGSKDQLTNHGYAWVLPAPLKPTGDRHSPVATEVIWWA